MSFIFINDQEYVGVLFKYMLRSGGVSGIYVMTCGKVAPAQRDIITRRRTINYDDHGAVLN